MRKIETKKNIDMELSKQSFTRQNYHSRCPSHIGKTMQDVHPSKPAIGITQPAYKKMTTTQSIAYSQKHFMRTH